MADLKHYLAEEVVEDYREGRLSRRRALLTLTGIIGAALAAPMLDAVAQTAPATPESAGRAPADGHVAESDPSVNASAVRFPAADAELSGYLAHPSAPGRHPIVLVCHENRGLTPHIRDVARRLAKAGYVALAVDLLSREGGTAQNDFDRIPGLLGNTPPARPVQDFQSGLAYAKAQSYARADRAGMVGFCYGGGVTWRVAAATPELRAIVPFYGQPVSPAEIARVQAAVLAIYAGLDQRIDATIPATEAAMQQNAKTFRKIVYPNVNHAFFNDTGGAYDPTAAQAAWGETLGWFRRYLQT